MPLPLPKNYLITDRHQIGNEQTLVEVIEQQLKAGIRLVQLREKDLSGTELYQLATELRSLTRRYQALLLINDRIDIVKAVAADGVHLGHQSLATDQVRRLLGKEKLIGVSTHSLQQARQAEKQGADFITFGPVFPTPSKAAYGPPVGLEKLKQTCRGVALPVYALGGIKENNIAAVLNAEAYGIAAISLFL